MSISNKSVPTKPIVHPLLHDRDWLVDQYVTQQVPIPVIAKHVGCSVQHVHHMLKRQDIPLHPTVMAPKRCASCWHGFTPNSWNQQYCSPECKHEGKTSPPQFIADLLRDI